MDEQNSSSDSRLVAELVSGLNAQTGMRGKGVVLPYGYCLTDVRQFLQVAPDRQSGCVNLDTLASFTDYCGRYLEPSDARFTRDPNKENNPVAVPVGANAIVWADISEPCFVAVLNEHQSYKDGYKPGWRDWVATFQPQYTPEWKTWKDGSGNLMSQPEFAEFIDTNLIDVIDPSQAEMLSISRTFEAKTKVDFSQSIRLDNGNVGFNYEDKTEATAGKGQIKVPDTFKIGVSIYRGEEPIQMVCRLNYRVSGGDLRIGYKFERPERVVQEAFASLSARITDNLPVTMLNGQSNFRVVKPFDITND